MKKHIVSAVALCLSFAVAAVAQLPAPAPNPDSPHAPTAPAQPGPDAKAQPAPPSASAPAETPSATPATEAAPAPEKPAGDVVRLKTGKEFKNVQIIRSTPVEYEIQVIEGSVTLKIPRRQVESVTFDNYEPSRNTGATAAAPKEERVLPADKLTPELSAKLKTAIPAPPVSLKDKDFVGALEDVAKRTGVNIEVDDSVKALPEADRLWSVELPAETTLMQFLQEHLAKDKPGLAIEYAMDKVVVKTKPAEAPAPTPQGLPTPPPAPEQ